MPGYLVERSFQNGLDVPPGREGREMLLSIIACNSDRKVTLGPVGAQLSAGRLPFAVPGPATPLGSAYCRISDGSVVVTMS